MTTVVRAAPRRLDRRDFSQSSVRVARDLLGKFIVRCFERTTLRAMIVEAEAYKGPQDAASHAYGGRRTPRVEPLYGDSGTVYVYLCYGIHWMLNFSVAGPGTPQGVLVRGILTDPDGDAKPLLGPGKVTRYLHIDKTLDGIDATKSRHLWLEARDVRVPPRCVRKGPRIGVEYAGAHWAARPWRFWIDVDCLASAAFASRRPVMNAEIA